jgi:hypothetical protein
MSVTLEDVEYEAWHFGAEPIAARMDKLKEIITDFAAAQVQLTLETPVTPDDEQPSEAQQEQQAALESLAAGGQLKECNTCKQDYPRNPENYIRDKTARDGYRNRCKKCDKIYRQTLAAKKKIRLAEDAAA